MLYGIVIWISCLTGFYIFSVSISILMFPFHLVMFFHSVWQAPRAVPGTGHRWGAYGSQSTPSWGRLSTCTATFHCRPGGTFTSSRSDFGHKPPGRQYARGGAATSDREGGGVAWLQTWALAVLFPFNGRFLYKSGQLWSLNIMRYLDRILQGIFLIVLDKPR